VSTIRTAADTIRARLDALPERARSEWACDRGIVRAQRGIPIVHALAWRDDADRHAIGALIATVASPDVAAALADLLETIARHNRRDNPHGWDDCDGECIDAIVADAGALADAITRRGQQ